MTSSINATSIQASSRQRKAPYEAPTTVWTRIATESGVCSASVEPDKPIFGSGEVHVNIYQNKVEDFSGDATWDSNWN